jgi:hypothetical protein
MPPRLEDSPMKSAINRTARDVRRMIPRLIGALAAIMIVGAPARAQTPAPATPPQTEGQAPSGDLSDRLDRSHGVIRPQGNVDPGISATPPDPNPGTMPVIPPPGSPGGDPRVQPK